MYDQLRERSNRFCGEMVCCKLLNDITRPYLYTLYSKMVVSFFWKRLLCQSDTVQIACLAYRYMTEVHTCFLFLLTYKGAVQCISPTKKFKKDEVVDLVCKIEYSGSAEPELCGMLMTRLFQLKNQLKC